MPHEHQTTLLDFPRDDESESSDVTPWIFRTRDDYTPWMSQSRNPQRRINPEEIEEAMDELIESMDIDYRSDST